MNHRRWRWARSRSSVFWAAILAVFAAVSRRGALNFAMWRSMEPSLRAGGNMRVSDSSARRLQPVQAVADFESEQERLVKEEAQSMADLRRNQQELERQRLLTQADREEFEKQSRPEKPMDQALDSELDSADVANEAIEEMRSRLDNAMDQLKRQAAEFQNFRARIAKDEDRNFEVEKASLAKLIIPLIDDFDRASANVGKDAQILLKPLRRKIISVLESEFQVKPMGLSVGKLFDIELHEAVAITPNDAHPDTILQELTQGFIGGRGGVIRPAKVIVSSGPES